ncbi:MAG TPA: Lrp/AsnC family transcriptional regulator [Candidatus Dormibacteraeota bacterium]|nr:Lrp/AsnC family transcriptional regulator [Candidatus Dormibacteraeota bacterium]
MVRRARTLDDIDKGIVGLLQGRPRATNLSIAEALGVSEATVRKRVARLLQARHIDFVLAVDPALFGFQRLAFIGVQVDIGKAVGAAEALCRLDSVNFLAYTSGTYDFLLIGQFHSDEELVDFLTQQVAQIPGVRRTETTFILRVTKRSALWGLPGPATRELPEIPAGSSGSRRRARSMA